MNTYDADVGKSDIAVAIVCIVAALVGMLWSVL